METLGTFLRTLREDCGLGLRELAKDVGISAPYLSLIERDLCGPPSEAVMEALAERLGVGKHELLRRAKRAPEWLCDALLNKDTYYDVCRVIATWEEADLHRLYDYVTGVEAS